MTKNFLSVDEIKKTLKKKGVPFERFLEAVRSGEITTLSENPDTGKMEKLIVEDIDDDAEEIYGRFLDD